MLNKIYLFIIFLFIIVPACGKNQSVDDLLEKGEMLISRVKPEEAIKCFNKAIDMEPDSMKAWFYKAIAFNSVPDYKKMKECLNIAINKDLIITKKNVNEKLLDGWYALSFAVYCDNLKAVKLLVKNGAFLNRMDVTGTTPLMLASSRGKKEIIDFLIDKGADINQKDNSGYGSLWCAVFYRQYETVGHLISRGADKSDFPIFYAVCMNDVEWIKKLLGKGENPDSRGFNNQTPLHFAGSVEVVELLLGKGADINAIDDEDITPLCRAIDRNNKKLIEFFIKKGSIINIPDVYGGTPLHRAVYNDNKGIAELLISCGALINEKDGLGRTPLDCAKSEGMKKILRKYGGKTHKEINKE